MTPKEQEKLKETLTRMQIECKTGPDLDHDYPINDDYYSYELFKQCKQEADPEDLFYSAFDILATDGELPRLNKDWQSQYSKDWRGTLQGNTTNMHIKCPNGYFSDDSQPIDQVKIWYQRSNIMCCLENGLVIA